eukprot:1048776-Karenia_brevis.AAC.1
MAAKGHVQAAVAGVLQYDTYARPSEVLKLTESDVLRPAPKAGAAYANRWAICIAPSTTAARTK